MKISFHAMLMLLLLAVAPSATSIQAQRQPQRLNVLFIAIDDLNNALGCYGHPLVKTPNIDRLAARGVKFDRAYVQYPLCNPSRTSFLSGRRPQTTRIYDNQTPPRTALGDTIFLPEHFKQHGYFTARVGKLAHDTFQDAVKWDISEDAKGQYLVNGQRWLVGSLSWEATERADADEPDGRTARRIAQLIEENKDRPFFIAAGFHKPHLPFVAPKKYFDLYPLDQIKLPAEPADDRKDIPPIALTRTPADDRMSDEEKRQVIRAYYASVSFVDAQVGFALDALERLKLMDRTVVALLGDHGYHLGEHGGLWRKMTVFEESARAPLIVAAPEKKRGAVSSRLVEFVDLYPTLTQLCGLPAPEGLEGASFAPLLDNPRRAWKRAAFTEVARGQTFGRSVRGERYRYTEWGDEKTAELYDHDEDPREFANLAYDPKRAKVVAQMRQLLKEGWRAALPGGNN